MPATLAGLALKERSDPVGMALGVCVEVTALFKTEESSKMRAIIWKLNIEQAAESQEPYFSSQREREVETDSSLSLSGSKGEKTRITFILQYSHHEH